MSGKILKFGHTDFTLKRRIERTCREDEREMVRRAAWMMQFDYSQLGCQTEEEWLAFLNGDYEP